MTGYHLIIGNGRFYGGRFSLTPGACLFEDCLECCLFLRPGRMGLIAGVLKVVLGRPLGPPVAEIFHTRRLIVRGEGTPVQIDGDFHGRLPMVFRSAPGELRMVLPKSGRREE
jgi:diacylglycerol kinase family enzyme